MDSILNDAEKAKVEAFCADTMMLEAVKKVLLYGIYHNGTLKAGEAADPKRNFMLASAWVLEATDEQIGQYARAAAEGIRVVESGFQELQKVTTKPPITKKKDNPAV